MGNPQSKKWFLILNPHAGSGRGKKDQAQILGLLKKNGFSFELGVSEFPKHAIQLTSKAIDAGYRNLVVAGGDGTLNEVVNGIFSQTVCNPEEIIVGMIPVGTGNDWIKTFGIPNHYIEAIKILTHGHTMSQDIGRISYGENGTGKTCYFANMAGFGFDAMVAEKTNRLKDQGKKGILLYLQALASSFLNYQTCKTRIEIDGHEIDEMIFSASIGIGKYNGGGMMQAPDAVPDNGMFQVTIIRKIGIFGILRNLAGLYSGEFVKDHRVSTHPARHISISSAKNISGEADGEILGDNKFTIELYSQKLVVIYYPEKYLKYS
ncbi:MAG: diacylglycerol kinase family protein [Prolixibacteraceae bacterium]|jgi:YegS/Rv2252/BmrU family lipid kinase